MADRDGGATKEIQERIERQTKRINSLQSKAFQVANFYFAAQAVVFTALTGGSTSLVCRDLWFPLVLSLVPAFVNITALSVIGWNLVNAIAAAADNTDADDDGGAGDDNDRADWAATDPDANDGSANAAGAATVFAADAYTDTEDGGSAGDDDAATADAANTDADDDGYGAAGDDNESADWATMDPDANDGSAIAAGPATVFAAGGADWRSFFKNKAYHLFLCMHDYFCYLRYCPSCR
ncbi:hypothetical protein RHGRI_003451 [Rhododendron griersonianum]|uniref:Uncharacterized protein n=1 Tax=Rhododendron griersonianum TaxID=479676 RepID=A0AAV6L529_9ERIC|nr:hypothetical protein RHGRI_003451 [Rhododendron griersonianum]